MLMHFILPDHQLPDWCHSLPHGPWSAIQPRHGPGCQPRWHHVLLASGDVPAAPHPASPSTRCAANQWRLSWRPRQPGWCKAIHFFSNKTKLNVVNERIFYVATQLPGTMTTLPPLHHICWVDSHYLMKESWEDSVHVKILHMFC